MYPIEGVSQSNGRLSPVFRTVLVVDDSVSRQLQLRTALRETGLFSLILSCESEEMARDVIEGSEAPGIALAVVALEMADACLPHMEPDLLSRTVITHDPEDAPDLQITALPRPVSAAVIADVYSRLV